MSDAEFAVTEGYQTKILAFMLQNPEFCAIASMHLQKEQFNNKALQWFFSTLSDSKYPLSAVTLREELLSAAKNKHIKSEEVQKFVTLYDVIKEKVTPGEEEYIKDKLGTFIRTQSVKQAMLESVDLAKNEQWESIVESMQEAINSGFVLEDTGYDYLGEVEARVQDRASRRVLQKVRTGIPELDNLTYGGVKPGQLGMIVGGTGRGKSIFLQWLARTALMVGKKVVYFTFELSKDDIADRMDSMFASVKPHELNDYQKEVIESITDLKKLYGQSLIIKHFPADTATVGTLKAFCRRLSEAGVSPDLIIVDYLDLVRPHRTYQDTHSEIDAVTKALVGFAAEFELIIWTATQMNRAGIVSETPDEAGMAGYIGKQYHSDIVLWMAQTKDEREDELMRLWVSKNRNGKVGTIKLETNYSYMTFYREQIQKDEDNTDDQEQPTPTLSDGGQSDLQLLLRESEHDKASGQNDVDG